MAKIPKIPGGLPEVTEWSPEPPQPRFTPNQPEFHGDGRYGAPPNPEPTTLRGGAAAGEAAPGAAKGGWFRRALPSAEAAGRVVGKATRVLGPAAAGADVVSHFNDFKINDPEVDSSLGGTFNALRQGNFSGAGRSLSKGLLETGMDVGSALANTADLVVPGKAPVSTAYSNMLRGAFGDQLIDKSGAAPATTPKPTAATLPVASYSNEGRSTTGAGPAGVSGPVVPTNPAGSILRTGNNYSGANIKFGADIRNPDGSLVNGGDPNNPKGFGVTSLDTSEGHRQNLLELQRNAAERAAAPAPSGAMGFGGRTVVDDVVAKGKSGGPDLSRLPPVRRAQMEASLRQSQDANANALNIAGLHDSTARAGMGSAQAIAAMHDATQRRSNDQNNATSLRGQDITYAGHMAPLRLAAMQRAKAAQVYQNLDHDGKSDITPDMHRKAGDMMNALGLKDMAKDAYGAAASGQAITGTQDDQKRKGHEDLVDVFRSDDRFNSPDPKNPGRMIFDADGAKQAAAGLFAAHGERLSKLPADQKKQAAAEIVARSRLQERLRQPEMSAMDHVKSWVGQYDRPADNNQLPDLSGARGLRRGATLIPGNNTNDRLIETKDGRRYNAGLLSDAEAKVLRDEGVR